MFFLKKVFVVDDNCKILILCWFIDDVYGVVEVDFVVGVVFGYGFFVFIVIIGLLFYLVYIGVIMEME